MAHEKLSALDSAFLHLERNGPLNVGSLGVFEGGGLLDDHGDVRVADVRRHLAGRLHLLPRFRKKLMGVPLGLGHPVWVDDASFDIGCHVREARLPAPGSDAQLHDLMARIQAEPLDRSRPLWELWVVGGLAGGRAAIIQKTHHALLDGISGVDAARSLFDRHPDPPDPPQPNPEWAPQPPPDRRALLAGAVRDSAIGALGALRAVNAVRAPLPAAGAAARLARTAFDGLQPASRCPLNVAVGPNRVFDTFSVAIADVAAVKRAVGCTANDIVLAVVAGALRHYLTARGERVEHLRLRAMVPVSVRRRRERMTLGNRVSAVFADLPVHVADPAERARATAAETQRLTRARHAEGIDSFLSAAEHVPAPLYAAVAARLPSWQRSVNLVVTHVPGPSARLYCLGAPLTEAYPWVAPVDQLALGVAVLRYDHRLFFGLSADADALPDMAVLADAMEKSVTELITHPDTASGS